MYYIEFVFFFFQAEDGIRDLVRSRGLGDVYKRQHLHYVSSVFHQVVLRISLDVMAKMLFQNKQRM